MPALCRFTDVGSNAIGKITTPLSTNRNTSDFNGGDDSDILFQNTTSGEIWIWEMNGNKVIGKGSSGNFGPSWQVTGQ